MSNAVTSTASSPESPIGNDNDSTGSGRSATTGGAQSTSTETQSLTMSTVTRAENSTEAEVTGFPPMTTHWSVPQSCTWTYNASEGLGPSATGAIAWLDLEPQPDASTLSCYPDGMFYGGRTGVFSPASCPGGWTTATVLANTGTDTDTETTTAICCSSEYSLEGTVCQRAVPTVLAVPISYNQSANTYTVTTSSTTTLYSATVAVYTIQALFREEDKDLLGLTDETEIDDQDHTSKLSVEAKIGIGVGAAVFGVVVIGIIIFIIFHRKQMRRKLFGKRGASHELDAVTGGRGPDVQEGRYTRRTNGGDNMSMASRRSSADGAEPPPAYEATPETNSLAESESGRSSVTRDGEIRALRAQKESIQRRIEELESVETDDSRERARI